jgi:oligosaccharide repeat unit polymerase
MISTALYFFIWIFIFLCQGAVSSEIYYPVPNFFYIFWVFSLILLGFVDYTCRTPKHNFSINFLSNSQKFSEKFLLYIFIVAAFTCASYSNFYFPALKFFGLPSSEYSNFGIPGLQGFVNACYLAISTLKLIRFLSKDKKCLFDYIGIVIIFLYPLILLSRQLIFTLVFQLIIFWLLFSKKTALSKIMKSFCIFLMLVIIFSIMGQFRSGNEDLYNFMGSEVSGKFIFLYWPYVYLTSSLSNLSLNLDISLPDNSLATFFLPLIPMSLRGLFDVDYGFEKFSNINLINPNLNTSTFFASGFLSFGWMGMIVLFLFLLAILLILKRSASKSIYNYSSYLVIIQIISFTFFDNLLFYWPVFFQIIIFMILNFCTKGRLKEKS